MLGQMSPLTGLRGGRAQESIPAAITDIGCEREINEDRYAVMDSASGRAWIVCDGMGGTLGGELAAQLAIDSIRRALESRQYDSPTEALRSSIEEANRVIVLRRQNPAFSSMGTTIVGAFVHRDELVIAHAGDSRAYLVRNGSIQQLTVDHTYVQDLVDRGAIGAEEALSHPQAHVLTRCLGAEPRLEVDVQGFWIWDVTGDEPEDKLVLCSDGLYSLISDDEIADLVTKLTPQEACARLVEMAKARGGYDNITLAVLPLGGQLRDENPGRSPGRFEEEPKRQRRGSSTTLSVAPALPLKQRIVIMAGMAALGSLAAAILMFVKLNNL